MLECYTYATLGNLPLSRAYDKPPDIMKMIAASISQRQRETTLLEPDWRRRAQVDHRPHHNIKF